MARLLSMPYQYFSSVACAVYGAPVKSLSIGEGCQAGDRGEVKIKQRDEPAGSNAVRQIVHVLCPRNHNTIQMQKKDDEWCRGKPVNRSLDTTPR